jgi:L-ascorbate metabolism protein UlaG (beta-lactamase superfamily)
VLRASDLKIMDITYLGHSSFRIKTKTAVVVTDPYDPKLVGLKYSGVEGDIVTVSHQHPDHNQSQLVGGARKVVDGPGEYEIMGVSILGYPSFHDAKEGAERGENTIYLIEADGLRVAHVGDLGHKLSDKMIEELGSIDILMLPVGGFYTIGPAEAAEVVKSVEPSIIIPMHYQVAGLVAENFGELAPVDAFLKEVGLPTEILPKLSIKKEELTEEQKVIQLIPQNSK